MAKYSDIKGFTVQTLASDTVPSQFGGGAWSSAPDMNTGRQFHASGGPSTSAIVFAGADPSSDYSGTAETFNGTAFSSAPNMNEGRTEAGGFATSSEAAIVAGGYTTVSPAGVRNTCESFNGSAWTETSDLGEGRSSANGTSWGTTTAGSFVAGVDNGSPGTNEQKQEYWNGSSWSEQGDLNLGRRDAGGAGIQTAGLVGGGMSGSPYPGTITNNTESWDGSSWTEVAEMNASKRAFGSSFGTYTEAIFAGGQAPPPVVANCEYYNGSTWTEVADLSATRRIGQGFGLATDGYAYGGIVGGSPKSVSGERFEAPSTFVKIQRGQLFFNSTTNTFKETISDVPATSWSSGTNLNQARSFNNASGDLTSAITFGGSPAPTQAYSEQWDGSSWTEVGDLNEGRVAGAGGGASGTDAIIAGGYELPNIGNTVNTEIWNGSSWTEVNDLNAQKYTAGSGIPVSTSGIAFGGNPVVATAEVWDGTNWTEVGDLNNARMYLGGFGNATSAIAANGVEPPHTQNKVEKWDGSSWTEVSEMNTARGEMLQGQGRTNESGIIAGGSPNGSSQITNTEIWNGSSWTELNDLATARRMGGQIGPTSSGMYIGGQTPSNVVTVEHWDSPLANKTITAS